MTNNPGRDRNGRIVPMTCAACGALTNPHAEKPVVPVTEAEAAVAEWAVGGLIEEVHQCPQCGGVQSRRV